MMAADLSVVPNTGIEAQLCGDAHVRNLGAFAAPDGRLVFDINDFDETIRGPFEWDLKRMAASLVVAGRESGHKEGSARQAVETCIGDMRTDACVREDAVMEVGRYQVHRIGAMEPVHEALIKAERATPLHTLEQLTEPASEKPGISAAIQRDRSPCCHGSRGHKQKGAGGAWAVSRDAGAAEAASALDVPAGRCGIQSGGDGVSGAARLLYLL